MGEIAHEAVSRRPPVSLDTTVARTHMHTYAAKVWILSVCRSATIFCRAVPNLTVTIRNCYVAAEHSHQRWVAWRLFE